MFYYFLWISKRSVFYCDNVRHLDLNTLIKMLECFIKSPATAITWQRGIMKKNLPVVFGYVLEAGSEISRVLSGVRFLLFSVVSMAGLSSY